MAYHMEQLTLKEIKQLLQLFQLGMQMGIRGDYLERLMSLYTDN